jgi:hypothetical protein
LSRQPHAKRRTAMPIVSWILGIPAGIVILLMLLGIVSF